MTELLLGFAAGLVLLVAGGEALVRGASRIAARLGIAPLIIGLTVVAFGTSTPELAVTLRAAWTGGPAADLAIANVVGSNIFNVLAILGLSAVLVPLVVSVRLIRLEVPIMIAVSAAALALGWNGHVGRIEGALLFAGFLGYVAFTLIEARRERLTAGGSEPPAGGLAIPGALVAAGLALLVGGAELLVASAVGTARALGIGEVVIGLTIVAAGTSLPEVATSVLAALRGERDIAVGNVIGSNIFNILSVLGLAALLAPAGVPVPASVTAFDGVVMLAVAIACLPVFATGHTIARWEGVLFLAYYAAYALYLILAATEHDALGLYSGVMLGFAVPLTAITLALTAYRHFRRPPPPEPFSPAAKPSQSKPE